MGQKIIPIGQSDIDLDLLRAIRDSGWRGPIGILNHTDEDAEARLLDNLEGLDWLVPQLDGRPAGLRPTPRSWKALPPARANCWPKRLQCVAGWVVCGPMGATLANW